MALAALLLCAAAPQDQKDKPQAPQDPPGVVRMTQEQQKTIKLQTARAERRPITEPVRVPGTVAFDEGHVARLRPYAEGTVLRLLAQPGDQVHAGQPLAELVLPGLLSAQEGLVGARATMSEAEATVAVAQDALRRGVILARDGSLARAEAERRRLVLAQAKATAEASRARMALLQAEITRLAPTGAPGVSAIVSPIDGVVVTVGVTPGEVISPTTEAFTVADLSVVLVQAQVPENSAALVKAGDPAEVHLAAHQGPTWQGRIIALSAALDPQARTLPARIRLANPGDTLRVGMFVDVTLTSDRGRDDIVVPSGAVQRVGDKRVAFTPLGDGRFQSHDLTLGVEQQDWDEVRNGLTVGDEVVTQGSFELKALLQKAMLGGAG
ncbi:efflux RND transporter periplasmic adaptor subunit [Rhodopila sp.]|uniref:efflux RND transporter periplasmic adaptor subunit n=1 Tax=Rhodopila sp. TaxID=2480087 RepID=UPI003D0CF7A0